MPDEIQSDGKGKYDADGKDARELAFEWIGW
jgi:hypothetical protein